MSGASRGGGRVRHGSAESAVDLMEAKSSEAERLSRSEARLRRRAEERALDSLSASENRRFHEDDGAVGRREGPKARLVEGAQIKCIS
jgi:hypothetical protein